MPRALPDPTPASARRTPAWLRGVLVGATILTVALMLFARRLPLVTANNDVGHADSASYALQALSLATGHGLQVPYVSTFYRPYPRDGWHRDDHWPPFLAFVLAPVFRLYGPDATKAHAVTLALGTLFLPLAAAWLAGAATRRAWAALAGGLLPLLSVAIFKDSISILSDIALAALVTAFAAALLSARRHPAWFIVCGLSGALAYYAKGSQLVLLPLLPVFAVLVHGWRILASRWLYAGCLAFALAVAPWWASNTVTYGNPFHTTQNYVSSFFGLRDGSWDDWDEGFYRVYWGHNLPSTFARFNDRPLFDDSVRRNSEEYLRALVLGPDATSRDWPRLGRLGTQIQTALRAGPQRERTVRHNAKTRRAGAPEEAPWLRPPRDWPFWYATLTQGPGLVWGGLALLLWGPLALAAAWRHRRRGATPAIPSASPPSEARECLGASAFLMSLILIEAAFIVVFWHAMPRFTTAVLPAAATLGLLIVVMATAGIRAGLSDAIAPVGRHLLARSARARRAADWWTSRQAIVACRLTHSAATAVLCLTVMLIWHAQANALAETQIERANLQEPTEPRYHALAQIIRERLPANAVIMSRNPWELLFYCPPGLRAVGLPYATPDVIFAVARYYGVTHFVWDKDRPGLREFIQSGHPALKLVIDDPLPVYAIDYAAFSPGEIMDEDKLGMSESPAHP